MVGVLPLFPGSFRRCQGQHRNVSQQMSRAPNSSEPLISTEARLGAFSEIFSSPQVGRQWMIIISTNVYGKRIMEFNSKFLKQVCRGGSVCQGTGVLSLLNRILGS